MKRVLLFYFAILSFNAALPQPWSTNGSNIYYNGGNVGIGISSPYGLFQVFGGSTYLQALNLGFGASTSVLTTDAVGKPIIFQEGGTEYARITNTGSFGIGTTNTNGYLLYVNGSASLQSVNLGFGASLAVIGTDASSKPISFQIGTTEYARLLANGSFGIGTTDTKGYLFAVNGSAIFTSARVKAYAYWPDFVFGNGYRLLSLDSVSSYIQTNHHLPDLPSADSVQSAGIDLGGTEAALLRKIEELTLYAIDQQKQLKVQQEQIKRLERLIEKKTKP